MRSALRQKVRVLEASATRHEIVYWNAGYSVPRAIRRLNVDAVILDNTLLVARWAPEFAARRPTFDWLADVGALKIAFPQDEYNHAHVLDDWLADLGVDVVFSVFGPEHRELLYPRLGNTARFEKCLTGYVDELDVSRRAAVVLPHDRRALDLAYRAQALDAALRAARPAQAHRRGRGRPCSHRPQVCASTSRPIRAMPCSATAGFPSSPRRGRCSAARAAPARSTAAVSWWPPSAPCWPSSPGLDLRRLRRRDARRLGRAAARLGRPATPRGRRRQDLPGARRGWLRRRPGAGGALPPGAAGRLRRRRRRRTPGRPQARRGDRGASLLPTSCSAAATATPRWPRSSSGCSTRSGRPAAVRGPPVRCAAPRPPRPPTTLAVVRPPRWAYTAVDRVAPGVIRRLERERVRWYRRGPLRRRP